MGMPGTALGAASYLELLCGRKQERWDPPNQVSESPSQECPTFQRHLDVTQPFLRALGGVGGSFSGDKEMPSHGSCCPPGSLIQLLQLGQGWESHGEQDWPKPTLWCLSRVGKAPPGSVSGRLNLSQNKRSSSFQFLSPTGLVCSPFLLQCLDSPASNYCLQI